MLYLPSKNILNNFNKIPLWIAPPGIHTVEFNHRIIPSRKHLISIGWTEVNIEISLEIIVLVQGGCQEKRI